MHLIKLSSNKDSFHEIKFNKGINYILGVKSNATSINTKGTYNGVGKSLLIEIIHFCLGSNSIKCFHEKLTGWSFRLQFSVKEEIFEVERFCDNQETVYLNKKSYSLTDFNKKMLELIFNFDENTKIKYITFRSLLSRFIRRYKFSYTSFDKYIKKEQEYATLLNNSYLLGLDTTLVQNKKLLKENLDTLNKQKKILDNDPTIKHEIRSNTMEIQLLELQDRINEYSYKIENFQIAENFSELESTAHDLTKKRKKLEKTRVLLENKLVNVNKGLNISQGLTLEQVKNMYKETKLIFPDSIKKNLEDVSSFHEKLLYSRQNRLTKQKNDLLKKIKEISNDIEKYGLELNSILKILNSHGALQEYNSVVQYKQHLEFELQKLSNHINMLNKIKLDISKAEAEFILENANAIKYIQEDTLTIKKIQNTFRNLAKDFYEDKASNIEITTNENKNKLRFNIDAKIIGNSSDGINEVTIFCFDLSLLLLKKTDMRLIFHDSRLLANMDPRQRVALLNAIEKEISYKKDSEFQYIMSINEDMIDSIKEILPEEEFTKLNEKIHKNSCLTLTDESSETKLLGIDIDLDYD